MQPSRSGAAAPNPAQPLQSGLRRRSAAWVIVVGLFAATAGFATPLGRNHPVPPDLTSRRSVPRVQLGKVESAGPAVRELAASRPDPAESVRSALIALGSSVRSWKKYSYATTGTSMVLLLLTGWLLLRSTRSSRLHRRRVRTERARRLREASAREAAESRAAAAEAAAVKAGSERAELERKMTAARSVVQRQLEARLAAEQEAAQALDAAEREISARESAQREAALARVVAEREVMARETTARAILDRQRAALEPTLTGGASGGEIDLAIDEAWSRAVARPGPRSAASPVSGGTGARPSPAEGRSVAAPRPSKPTGRAARRRSSGATVHRLDAHRVRRQATDPTTGPETANARPSREGGRSQSAISTRHRELLQMSQAAAHAGRNEKALDLALRAHQIWRSRECVLHLTRLLAEERRFEIGDTGRLRRAVRNYPDEPVFLYAAGVHESMYGDPRRALALIEAAIQRERQPKHRERMLRDCQAIRLKAAAQA